MVEQLLNSLLFYFFSDVVTWSATRWILRDPLFVGIFFLIFGDTLVLQMGDTVGPRYTAPKISAISYLFKTFSLLIMGDTERPRYTGFRSLSVRGITALQCIREYFEISLLRDSDCQLNIQLTLVISKSKGPSKTVRDIRTSTYQICSIEDKTIWTTNFYKWLCNLTPLNRNMYWKYCGKGEKLLPRSNFSSFPQYFITWF